MSVEQHCSRDTENRLKSDQFAIFSEARRLQLEPVAPNTNGAAST